MIGAYQHAAVQDHSRDRLPAPRILPGFSIRDRTSLVAVIRQAFDRLEEIESCGALFEGLDFDGPESFSRSYYEPASTDRDIAICRKGAAAISGLRGRRIRLCPSFQRHSPRDQVAILIHENLHIAGLSEQPMDPAAMTSSEITRWVKKKCDL